MKGEDLRAWRERFGLTQEQLAAALDVAPNTVARWERGEREIPPTQPLLLAILEQHASKEIEEIMAKLTEARAHYYAAPKGNAEARREADRKLLAAVSKALRELERWEEGMQARIEQVYVRPRVTIPKNDDPAWTLIRKTRIWTLLENLRREKEALGG